MSRVFLEICSDIKDSRTKVTLETFVSLFVYHYIDLPETIQVNLVKTNRCDSLIGNTVEINISGFNFHLISSEKFDTEIASLCHFPVLVNDSGVLTAGLCGVCRGMIKQQSNSKYTELLGFKGSCLLAPSEVSIWTRFCEIDFINCTKRILEQTQRAQLDHLECPLEIRQFESHMSQPVRVHNVYKLARELANESFKKQKHVMEQQMDKLSITNETEIKSNDLPKREKSPRVNKHRNHKIKKNPIQISCSTPVCSLNLNHKFAESQCNTLADLILYSCTTVIRSRWKIPSDALPLTTKWIESIESVNLEKFQFCSTFLSDNKHSIVDCKMTTDSLEIPIDFSFYRRDVKRYKPKNRIFTRQCDIDESLACIDNLQVLVTSQREDPESSSTFDWSTLPLAAMPEGGQLPVDRLERKKHQLSSLAEEIIEMARPGDRIVDFCSGTGHLGIILAYKLPQCSVILLENKEESLMRAKNRVDDLGLTNVLFVQSNLDYFRGIFDIGTSLHACGVATDIVLSHCLRVNAGFVCCPCCYGGIHDIPHLNYPQSKHFRAAGIRLDDLIRIAHCADQAHDINLERCNIVKSQQGQLCMDIVDTDRKLFAEEHNYRVQLTRLKPENCTPKNRLLIGMKI